LKPRWWLVVALIALGVARIAATYPILNSTSDEPAHINAGMEVLQYGAYSYELQHPPLARIAVALGPYFAGARSPRHRDMARESFMTVFQDGSTILYEGDHYWRTLTLARLGVLPFFVLLCVVVHAWARRWFSESAGLWALLFSLSTPPLLGHAGLATLDLACAAGVTLTLYTWLRWLEDPGASRAIYAGAAFAFALLIKFSSGPFLLACGLVLLLWKRPLWRDALIASVTTIGLLWIGYGFDVGALGPLWGPHPKIEATLVARPLLRPFWDLTMQTPVPFPKLLLGLRDVLRHNALGHGSYLFGEYRTTGWWYFFPVVVAVKTPLSLLGLALWGAFGLASWQQRATTLFPLAILLVCLPSQIDLGSRHILSIYPALAIVGGGLVARTGTWPVLALAALLVAESFAVHPDYLAYFNPLVGGRPERVLAESDLDWGQDLNRLARRLRELKVDQVSVKYFGTALLDEADLPPYVDMDTHTPVKGWVAVSLHYLYLEHAHDGSFEWIKRYAPRERIGKSIDLFYID
jgi:hypothetical protein